MAVDFCTQMQARAPGVVARPGIYPLFFDGAGTKAFEAALARCGALDAGLEQAALKRIIVGAVILAALEEKRLRW